MKTYNVKESAEMLATNTRMIQRKCKRDDIRKRDNKYLITQDDIDKWKLEIESRDKRRDNLATNDTAVLQSKIESLENKLSELKRGIYVPDDFLGYETLDNGNTVLVIDPDTQNDLDDKLVEWQTQKEQIELNEKRFNKELLSKDDQIKHYQQQFLYQQQQSAKILEIHEKLVNTIQLQAKNTTERNYIEARDKNMLDKDGKPTF